MIPGFAAPYMPDAGRADGEFAGKSSIRCRTGSDHLNLSWGQQRHWVPYPAARLDRGLVLLHCHTLDIAQLLSASITAASHLILSFATPALVVAAGRLPPRPPLLKGQFPLDAADFGS